MQRAFSISVFAALLFLGSAQALAHTLEPAICEKKLQGPHAPGQESRNLSTGYYFTLMRSNRAYQDKYIQPVEYYSREAQMKNRVHFKNGELFYRGWPMGLKECQTYNFVLVPEGRLIVALSVEGETPVHHSALAAGQGVASAGEISVCHGRIEWISARSGHYLPPLWFHLQMKAFLSEAAVATNHIEWREFSGHAISELPKVTIQDLRHLDDHNREILFHPVRKPTVGRLGPVGRSENYWFGE